MCAAAGDPSPAPATGPEGPGCVRHLLVEDEVEIEGAVAGGKPLLSPAAALLLRPSARRQAARGQEDGGAEQESPFALPTRHLRLSPLAAAAHGPLRGRKAPASLAPRAGEQGESLAVGAGCDGCARQWLASETLPKAPSAGEGGGGGEEEEEAVCNSAPVSCEPSSAGREREKGAAARRAGWTKRAVLRGKASRPRPRRPGEGEPSAAA